MTIMLIRSSGTSEEVRLLKLEENGTACCSYQNPNS